MNLAGTAPLNDSRCSRLLVCSLRLNDNLKLISNGYNNFHGYFTRFSISFRALRHASMFVRTVNFAWQWNFRSFGWIVPCNLLQIVREIKICARCIKKNSVFLFRFYILDLSWRNIYVEVTLYTHISNITNSVPVWTYFQLKRQNFCNARISFKLPAITVPIVTRHYT